MHGVDAYGNTLRCKPFDDGNYARRLDPRVDPSGARASRLPSDVNNSRAFRGQCQTVRYGVVGIEVAPAI
jgi:hypothetical protein